MIPKKCIIFSGCKKGCILKVVALYVFYSGMQYFLQNKIFFALKIYIPFEIIHTKQAFITCLNNWSQLFTHVHCKVYSLGTSKSYFITDDGPQSRTTVSPEEQIIQQRGRLRSSPRRKALTSNSPRIKVTEMGKKLNWFIIIIFDNAKQKCK